MKLNYKRIMLVSLAFFSIMMFWQIYDTLIAKILIDKFGLNQFWSGVIMSIDNILALALLPIFGGLSDKSSSKRGKRTPYIFIGTIIAAVAFIGLGFVDNIQTGINKKIAFNDEHTLTEFYDYNHSASKEDKLTYDYWRSIFNDLDENRQGAQDTKYFQDENYLHVIGILEGKDANNALVEGNIATGNLADVSDFYHNFLSNRTWEHTKTNLTIMIVFVVVLLIVLVAMSIYRSPAVALTPDIVVKPIRSRANAIVNLAGAAGGILAMVILIVFSLNEASYVNYLWGFVTVGVIMLISLVIFMFTVKEAKWVKERELLEVELGLKEPVENAKKKLTRQEITSLLLILSSVFLWYMGYNAVISKVSDYAPKVLGMEFAFPLIIAQGAAIISYIPIGILSAKLGRKKTIIAGVVILMAAFVSVYFFAPSTPLYVAYIVFAFIGIGWATINVNSYPMVVDLSKDSDVGKYTGYYYAFSMAAQVVTPILSGALMVWLGRTVLFPYAAIFVALSLITMLFVKHGDSEGPTKKSLLESFDVED